MTSDICKGLFLTLMTVTITFLRRVIFKYLVSFAIKTNTLKTKLKIVFKFDEETTDEFDK